MINGSVDWNDYLVGKQAFSLALRIICYELSTNLQYRRFALKLCLFYRIGNLETIRVWERIEIWYFVYFLTKKSVVFTTDNRSEFERKWRKLWPSETNIYREKNHTLGLCLKWSKNLPLPKKNKPSMTHILIFITGYIANFLCSSM